MMKLFHTPASPFVRKCTVTLKELGLWDQVAIIPTKWPNSWGTETVRYREDFLAATPIARILALVIDDGERLTEIVADLRLPERRGRTAPAACWRIFCSERVRRTRLSAAVASAD
jgi:hypothetical protein